MHIFLFHITYTATAYVDVSVYLFTIANILASCKCELNCDSNVSSSSKLHKWDILQVNKICKLQEQELSLLKRICCTVGTCLHISRVRTQIHVFVVVKDLVPCNNSLKSTWTILLFNAVTFHRSDIWLIHRCTMSCINKSNHLKIILSTVLQSVMFSRD